MVNRPEYIDRKYCIKCLEKMIIKSPDKLNASLNIKIITANACAINSETSELHAAKILNFHV